MTFTQATPRTPLRPDGARGLYLRLLAVAIVVGSVVVGIPILIRGPAFVDRLSVANPTRMPVEVSVSAPGSGVLSLGSVAPRSAAGFADVVDMGDEWEVHLVVNGRAEVTTTVSRETLTGDGWTFTIPEDLRSELVRRGGPRLARLMPVSPDITEQDLPGIGRSYTVDGDDGTRVLVVLHHSGRRDLYVLADADDDDPTATVTFSDDQARRLGAVLSGAYFKPAAVAQVEAVIGGLLIDWATVRADSPGLDHSIEALAIRQQTRMTVAAIVHADGSSLVAPEPSVVLRLGDKLVVVGRPVDLPAFLELVIG